MKFYQYINETRYFSINPHQLKDDEEADYSVSPDEDDYDEDKFEKSRTDQDLSQYLSKEIESIISSINQFSIKGLVDYFNNHQYLYKELIDYCLIKGIKKILFDWKDEIVVARSNHKKDSDLNHIEYEYWEIFSTHLSEMIREFIYVVKKDIAIFIVQTQKDDIIIEDMLKNFKIDNNVKLAWIKRNPNNFKHLKNPTKQIIQYMIDNYPWVLIDSNFDKHKDLKEKWQRIGNARKQIGL